MEKIKRDEDNIRKKKITEESWEMRKERKRQCNISSVKSQI
jgi:hypothetical protein